jgi:hypothetical protein
MRWQQCRRVLLLAGAVATMSPLAAAVPLTGSWGGDRLQMTIDEHAVRVETECASGTFVGPVTPGVDGRFIARGTYEEHGGGPQRADGPARAARFNGEVHDGVMHLSIWPEGATEALQFTLRQEARIKLVRCL